MKFKKVIAGLGITAGLLVAGMSSSYADTNCAGTVKFVLNWQGAQGVRCEDNLAYILAAPNGAGAAAGETPYLCTQSKEEIAMILTAQATGANVIARISGAPTSCSQVTTQYTTPTYIAISAPE